MAPEWKECTVTKWLTYLDTERVVFGYIWVVYGRRMDNIYGYESIATERAVTNKRVSKQIYRIVVWYSVHAEIEHPR